jgi:MSHA biogenesis protein MshQ
VGTYAFTVSCVDGGTGATLTTFSQNLVVVKANQTITFGAQAAQTYSSGGTFAISPLATASSGLAITCSSTTTGVCTIAGTTVTIVTAGTCTIAANQAGNTNYNAAPQVTQNVTINNQAPTTTSISPSSKIVGDALFTMTVNGTNFVSTSVVNFNGSARTTTFVSATQLTATIPASDMTVAGTFNITVVNPAPGGGTSNAQVFTVVTPVIPVSSFNAFETTTVAGATTGVIQTKIAGSTFSLDVVAISGGAQSAGFTNAVKVELLGNTVTGIALDAQNCPASSTLLQTVSPNPTISGGRSTVNFAAVADAWKDVRVRISYPAAAPTVISCSTDNFAIRPNSLTVSVTDTDWQTAGTLRTLNNSGATGGSVHKAGQPFTVKATAKNTAAVITGNYAGSPAAQPIVCTLPTPTCINGTLTPGAWTAAGGTVTSTTATYTEAGSFNLILQDTSFASVDSSDGTPATCAGYYVCSAAISVGRFVPDHFVLAASNVPQLKTFNNTACVIRSFTYIGQAFGYVTAPQVLVTAKNSANATTTNYTGNLWELATAAGAQDCTTNPDICTLSSGSVTQTYTYTTTPAATPNWDSTQVSLGMPVVVAGTVVAGTNGTGTITSNTTDLLAFKRSITTPLPLFTASITLTDSVKDTSEYTAGVGNCGVAVAGGCDITTLTPAAFNPIAFDSGNEFRYGRLKLSNADGSELLKLPIPIQTQYWNGTSFVTNTADNCTTLLTTNIKLTAPPAGVSATVGGALSSGVGSLILSPPSPAANAVVNLCVDLGADPAGGIVCVAPASANLPYLQGLWAPGTSYNNDPVARATFGVYKGPSEFIYLRENY